METLIHQLGMSIEGVIFLTCTIVLLICTLAVEASLEVQRRHERTINKILKQQIIRIEQSMEKK